MIDTAEFERWKAWSKRDDWHTRFVGSDVRVMLGEIEQLRAALAPFAAIGVLLRFAGPSIPDNVSAQRLKLVDGLQALHFKDAAAAFNHEQNLNRKEAADGAE